MWLKQLLGVLILCAAYLETKTQIISNIAQDPSIQQVSAGSEAFALDLFKRIAKAVEPKDYDFMISPFSVWTLLLLTAEGAAGNTLRELQSVLRLYPDFQSLHESFVKIQSALNVNTSTIEVDAFQAIFPDVNKPAHAEYQNVLQKFYGANIIPVNYLDTRSSKHAINDYVAKATRGRINYVVNEADLLSSHLVLISTIYFRGQWKFPFNKTLTRVEPFYSEEGGAIRDVNLMYTKGPFPYTAIPQIDSHVLELPYGKENRLVMIIFLPRRGVPLTTVIDKIATLGVAVISNELRRAELEYVDDEVEVFLPRFSTESDFQLNGILEHMGILDAFDENKAKFPKMSDYKLFITSIFHKTKIEVTEEGTQATGATGGIFANKATPPKFLVNRPFAYIILEKSSNSLLFCGQVRKPDLF